MPVSSDIYGQIQQPRQRNVLADFANIQQIQQGQAQNELMRLKMDEYQRGIGEQNRLRDILQGTEESQLAEALRRGGFLQQSQDYTKGKIANDKATADADKSRIDAAKAKIGLAGSAAKYVMDNPTPENALAAIQHLADNGIWKPEQAAQYAQQVQANPGGIKQMAEMLFRGALDADKQLLSRFQTDAGGTITNSTFDPVTGQTGLISTTQKTATPGELMTDKRAREEGAANRGVAIRGQNLTDARARERLAFDQAQPKGVLDPERGLLVDPRSGEARPVTIGGKPVGMKDKPLTEGQAKANLFGTRMQESHRILNDLEGKYSPAAVNAKMAAGEVPIVGGVAGYAGNLMLSEDGQKAEQAMRDFINAVLRRESGAVISPSEFANAQKQYFPQPGDTKEVVAQKRRNRELAIRGLEAEIPNGFRASPTLTNPGREGGATGVWDEKSDPLGLFRK